jgi:hypothetical protein
MPKGEKLRPKQNGSANHLWILKIEGIRIWFFCQNTLIAKIWSLMGENFDYGKRGSFGTWSILLLEYLSICPNKGVWLRDRKIIWFAETNQVVAKSDPNMPNLE